MASYETSPAWDEPIMGYGYVCNSCGAYFTDPGSAASHVSSAHGSEGAYYQTEVQTGTIHHDAVYAQEWVTTAAAKDEEVLTGYLCEECGETKAVEPESS